MPQIPYTPKDVHRRRADNREQRLGALALKKGCNTVPASFETALRASSG
jgi:hypothetical protein